MPLRRHEKFVATLMVVAVICTIFPEYRNYLTRQQKQLELLYDEKPLLPHQIEEKDDFRVQRVLTVDGSGSCRWVNPKDVPQDPEYDLFSTVLAGYPGSGKRFAYMQLEGLTELLTVDDYNLSEQNKRYALYKTQYPHHEGIWSWTDKGRQTILLLQNPRTALVSYQHLLHEIDYAVEWEIVYGKLEKVYTARPPISSWESWRDLRFDIETKCWRWFLDFWLEGGLFRDVFTHELTNAEHHTRLRLPHIYSEAELRSFQENVENDIAPTYDEHCGPGKDMNLCTPVAVATYEGIVDPITGPQEVEKLTIAIEDKPGITMLKKSARECMWRRVLIDRIPGFRDSRDREGPEMEEYMFTIDQLYVIIDELVDARDKYSSNEWADDELAQQVVIILDGYIAENESYLRKRL